MVVSQRKGVNKGFLILFNNRWYGQENQGFKVVVEYHRGEKQYNEEG